MRALDPGWAAARGGLLLVHHATAFQLTAIALCAMMAVSAMSAAGIGGRTGGELGGALFLLPVLASFLCFLVVAVGLARAARAPRAARIRRWAWTAIAGLPGFPALLLTFRVSDGPPDPWWSLLGLAAFLLGCLTFVGSGFYARDAGRYLGDRGLAVNCGRWIRFTVYGILAGLAIIVAPWRLEYRSEIVCVASIIVIAASLSGIVWYLALLRRASEAILASPRSHTDEDVQEIRRNE
jgi:hypothetical protein